MKRHPEDERRWAVTQVEAGASVSAVASGSPQALDGGPRFGRGVNVAGSLRGPPDAVMGPVRGAGLLPEFRLAEAAMTGATLIGETHAHPVLIGWGSPAGNRVMHTPNMQRRAVPTSAGVCR